MAVRDDIDARLAALWPQLVSKQEAYRARTGRYWQGLHTHSVDPADGAAAAADGLSRRPTDQPDDWPGFGVASWTEAFSLRIDVYDGPLGKGWIATVRVTLAGATWVRSRSAGPENRDRPWEQL